jgi:hypothetical protein
MLNFLQAYRLVIIWWVTVSLMPVEVVFDAVEVEIEKRGGVL